MKKTRLFSLMLLLLLPSLALAQSSAAANASWPAFWKQFSAAVNKKDRVSLKRMMATPFDSGGGEDTPAKWVKLMDKENLWKQTQQSVATGTRPFDEYSRDIGKPSRVTNRRHLIFVFSGGRWRWAALMGD